MRAIIISIALIALTGCSQEPESEKLEAQAATMFKAGASKEEQCAQARKVAQAYLEEGKAEEYEGTAAEARLICG